MRKVITENWKFWKAGKRHKHHKTQKNNTIFVLINYLRCLYNPFPPSISLIDLVRELFGEAQQLPGCGVLGLDHHPQPGAALHPTVHVHGKVVLRRQPERCLRQMSKVSPEGRAGQEPQTPCTACMLSSCCLPAPSGPATWGLQPVATSARAQGAPRCDSCPR